MLSSRLFFVTAVLTFFQIATAFSTPAYAGTVLLQEEPAAKQDGKKAKPEAKERLELLMKHKFDRTPKGILEAWSADKVKKKKKKKSEDEKEPITAEVTNLHKDFVFLQLKDEKSPFKKDQIVNVLDDEQKIIGKIKILTIEGKEISAKTEKMEPVKKAGEDKSKSDDKTDEGSSEAPEAEGVQEMEIEEKVSFTKSNTVTRTYTVNVSLGGQVQAQEEKESATETESDDEKDDEKEDGDKAENNEKKDNEEAKKESDAPKTQPLAAKVGDVIELQPIDLKEKAKQQTERLQAEVKKFARSVSLGNWDEVKEYMSTNIKDKKEAQKLYVYILNELVVSMPQYTKKRCSKAGAGRSARRVSADGVPLST